MFATIMSVSFAFLVNGCSAQESIEQDDVISQQIDGRLVGRLPVVHPDAALPITATTQFVMLGGEAFLPGRPGDYSNSFGNGGACISSGSNALAAPIQLPQGAVITAFKVFFNDTSATTDLSVDLEGYVPSGGFYVILANVTSAGISGLGNRSTTSIASPTVDNTTLAYDVRAFSSAWNCNMHINAALITYTL
jgi:hypothetical protein